MNVDIADKVGTAFVARDINAIFDALADADNTDGLIRYYGKGRNPVNNVLR